MKYLKHLLDRPHWKYFWGGIGRRLAQKKTCPCCHSLDSTTVDRKLVYRLERCKQCLILYRFPYETPEQMHRFYQGEYTQAGLTTDLPSAEKLRQLLKRSFAGSEKDFSQLPSLLRDLGLTEGARILDYGANWGYCTFQLRQAGFAAEGYEISTERAAFAAKLGVSVATKLACLAPGFDAVYSGHVLQHTPNPLATLREHLSLTRPGGFVIAHTPNGSNAFQKARFSSFHRFWGLPHPVLLTDAFIAANLGDYPYFIAATNNCARAPEVAEWDQRQQWIGDLAHQPELLIILRNTPVRQNGKGG
jgi:2-polyprenyl-3-methyl-5-hydroxy-6-metoxy-1,4-benzoquinol methylase